MRTIAAEGEWAPWEPERFWVYREGALLAVLEGELAFRRCLPQLSEEMLVKLTRDLATARQLVGVRPFSVLHAGEIWGWQRVLA